MRNLYVIEPPDGRRGPRCFFRATEETALRFYEAGAWKRGCVLRRIDPGTSGVVVAS